MRKDAFLRLINLVSLVSDLYRKVVNGSFLREPVVNINGNDIRPLLLGDGAYALLPWLFKPYPNNIV